MNVLETDYIKAIRKIHNLLKQDLPEATEQLDKFFVENFADYIKTTGGIKGHEDFRTPEFIAAVHKYKLDNKITVNDTHKEGGKLEFLTDPNKNQIKLIYIYLAQLHHFTGNSFIFYKDKDFIARNRDFSLGIIYQAVSACFEIFSDITPGNPIIERLRALAKEIIDLATAMDVQEKARIAAKEPDEFTGK